jgi:hypothetical protein
MSPLSVPLYIIFMLYLNPLLLIVTFQSTRIEGASFRDRSGKEKQQRQRLPTKISRISDSVELENGQYVGGVVTKVDEKYRLEENSNAPIKKENVSLRHKYRYSSNEKKPKQSHLPRQRSRNQRHKQERRERGKNESRR